MQPSRPEDLDHGPPRYRDVTDDPAIELLARTWRKIAGRLTSKPLVIEVRSYDQDPERQRTGSHAPRYLLIGEGSPLVAPMIAFPAWITDRPWTPDQTGSRRGFVLTEALTAGGGPRRSWAVDDRGHFWPIQNPSAYVYSSPVRRPAYLRERARRPR